MRLRRYIFVLIGMFLFFVTGYSFSISVVTNCTNFYLNINRSSIYNDSLINVYYFNSSGAVQILSAWMNNTNDTYNFSLTLPSDYVNYTIVVKEKDFNLSNGTLINVNNASTTVTLGWYYLNISANTTLNYLLNSFYVNLSLSSNNTNLIYNTATTIKVLNNCLVTIQPDTNTIYNGREFYGLYWGGVFYSASSLPVSLNIVGDTGLVLTYKTLLNNSKIYISAINGTTLPTGTLQSSNIYVPYGSSITVVVHLIDEKYVSTTGYYVYLILNSTNLLGTTTLYSGLNNTSYVNETVIPTGFTSYEAVVNYSQIYNNTTIGPLNVTPTTTWYIVNASKAFLNLSNRTVSCAFVSEYGWNYVKALLNTDKFYLKPGVYDPTWCGRNFFNFANIQNLTLIGLNRATVLLGGYENYTYLNSITTSTTQSTATVSIVYLNNTYNVTFYNMSFIEYHSTSPLTGYTNYVEYIIYLYDSSEINISNCNIYSESISTTTPQETVYGIYETGTSSLELLGDYFEPYISVAVATSANLLVTNTNFSSLSSGIGVIANQGANVKITYSNFDKFTGAVYLSGGVVNVSFCNFYNDTWTIYSASPENYTKLTTLDDYAQYDTYYGYIMTVKNVPSVTVTNRSYNLKMVYKLIVINSSDVVITDVNNSTGLFYEYGYDKIVLINVTNFKLLNTTIENSVYGVVEYPNITNVTFFNVTYEPRSSLKILNAQRVNITKTTFDISSGPMIRVVDENPSAPISEVIYLNDTSFDFGSNTESAIRIEDQVSIPINLNLNDVTTTSPTKFKALVYYTTSTSTNGVYGLTVNIKDSNINNASSVFLLTSSISKISTVSLDIDYSTFNYVGDVLNLSKFSMNDVDLFLQNSTLSHIGYVLYLDSITPSLVVTPTQSSFEFYNNTITDVGYLYLVNNTTIPLLFSVTDVAATRVSDFVATLCNDNQSTITFDGLGVNNTNPSGFGILLMNDSNSITIENSYLNTLYNYTLKFSDFDSEQTIDITNTIIKNITKTAISFSNVNDYVDIDISGLTVVNNTSLGVDNVISFKNVSHSNITLYNVNIDHVGASTAGIYLCNINNTLSTTSVNMTNINVDSENTGERSMVYGIYTGFGSKIYITNAFVGNITWGIVLNSIQGAKLNNVKIANIFYKGLSIVSCSYVTVNNINVTRLGKEVSIPVAEINNKSTGDIEIQGSVNSSGACIYVSGSEYVSFSGVNLTQDDVRGIQIAGNPGSVTINDVNAPNFCKSFKKYNYTSLNSTEPYFSATCFDVIEIDSSSGGVVINNVYASNTTRYIGIFGSSNVIITNITGETIGPIQFIVNSTKYVKNLYPETVITQYYNTYGVAKRPMDVIDIDGSNNISIKNIKVQNIGKNFAGIYNSSNVKINYISVTLKTATFTGSYFSNGVKILNSSTLTIDNCIIRNFTSYGIYGYNVTQSLLIDNTTLMVPKNGSVGIKLVDSDLTNEGYINNTTIYGPSGLLLGVPAQQGTGVELDGAENLYMYNDILKNLTFAINLTNVEGFTMTDCTILNALVGIRAFYSGGLHIVTNYINDSRIGIWLKILNAASTISYTKLYNTTYPLFVDADGRPPINVTNLSYLNLVGDYVYNYAAGASGYLVLIKNTISVTVDGNYYGTTPVYALYLYNVSYSTINNSKFVSNGNGLMIEDCNSLTLQNNTISQNLNGLQIYDSTGLIITGTTFNNNSLYTMYVYDLRNNSVTRSIISDTKIDYTRVSEFDNCSGVTLDDFDVTDNNQTGLLITNSSDFILQGFNFENIGVPMVYRLKLTNDINYPILDIELYGDDGIELTNSTFLHGGQQYLSNFVNYSKNIEYYNVTFNNTSIGLAVTNSKFVSIEDSLFIYNNIGLKLYSWYFKEVDSYSSPPYESKRAVNTTVKDSSFLQNNYGIYMNGSNNTTIQNDLFENNEYGVYLKAHLWGKYKYSCYPSTITVEEYAPNSHTYVLDSSFIDNDYGLLLGDVTSTSSVACSGYSPFPIKDPDYPDYLVVGLSNFTKNNYGIDLAHTYITAINNSMFLYNNNSTSLSDVDSIWLDEDNYTGQAISTISGSKVINFYVNGSTFLKDEQPIKIDRIGGTYAINYSDFYNNPTNVIELYANQQKLLNLYLENNDVEFNNGSFLNAIISCSGTTYIENNNFYKDNQTVLYNDGNTVSLIIENNKFNYINGSIGYWGYIADGSFLFEFNDLENISGGPLTIAGASTYYIGYINVSYDTVYNMTPGPLICVTETEKGEIDIRNNTIKELDNYTLYLTNANTGYSVYIQGNDITKSTNGIHIHGTVGNVYVNNNNISLDTGDLVNISGTIGILDVENNGMYSNSGTVISSLGTVQGLIVKNNGIENNVGTGVYVSNVSANYVEIVSNGFQNNSKYGVYVTTNNNININVSYDGFSQSGVGLVLHCYKPSYNLSVLDLTANNDLVSGFDIECPSLIKGLVEYITADYAGSAIGWGVKLSVSNATVNQVEAENNSGYGIVFYECYNVSASDLTVINNTKNGVNVINSTILKISNLIDKYNAEYGVYVIYSTLAVNASNITGNGDYGVAVVALTSAQRVFFNYSYICGNINTSSYDISNLNYVTNFIAVLHSWFGHTYPNNPYQAFFVANQYLNAYPDSDYFCNGTKQGFGTNVGAGKITNITVVKIPFLPKATSYVMVVKGSDVGAVALAKNVMFRPFCPMPRAMGPGKYILIISQGRVSVA